MFLSPEYLFNLTKVFKVVSLFYGKKNSLCTISETVTVDDVTGTNSITALDKFFVDFGNGSSLKRSATYFKYSDIEIKFIFWRHV